jgi:hypothetical protein
MAMLAVAAPAKSREAGEVARERVGEEPDRGHHDRQEEERTPAVTVGEAAPDRREDELHRGVAGHEPADAIVRRAEPLGVERHDRDDHPEAEQVDEDDDEQDGERSAVPHARRM